MKKVHQSNVGLLPVNIILIKVTRNNMKFLSIEITTKKMSKQLGIFANRNYIKNKIRRNVVEIRRYFIFREST